MKALIILLAVGGIIAIERIRIAREREANKKARERLTKCLNEHHAQMELSRYTPEQLIDELNDDYTNPLILWI